MRICFVSGEYPPMQGGVGDYTRELCRALTQLGHQAVVVTSSKAASRPQTFGVVKQTPKVLDEQTAGVSREPVVHPIVGQWDWASWTPVLRTAGAFQSHVLHIQYQTAAYAMHPAINWLPFRLHLDKERPRTVVTFHDVRAPYLFPKAGPAREWVNRALARWSDAVIATNLEDHQSLAHWLRPRGHQPEGSSGNGSLHLIPIGSNIHPQLPVAYDRALWRSQLGVADDETLLCYFGFLNASKGGETLFRTVANLAQRGQKVKLLMVGGQVGDSDPTNRDYLQYVKALSAGLGLTDLVLWTGYTASEQLSAHFAAADICILPYRDGASYRRGSFMAALAHGLPIVSTQPRVPITTLLDGENIVLVPPDNATATADAVEQLMASPALRAQLARGALELAKSFTWDKIAAQTAQLYSELLGE